MASAMAEAARLPTKELAKERGAAGSPASSPMASCFSGVGAWMRTKPEGPPMEARRAVALGELARQFTAAPPPELLRLFPQWASEFAQVLASADPEQVLQGLRGIEQAARNDNAQASAIAFRFAKSAFRAALEVHELLGDHEPHKSGGRAAGPAAAPAAGPTPLGSTRVCSRK
jgi:hypothetical protein